MKKTGKKLLVSIASLGLSFASMTAATFAWITQGSVVSTGNIDINVTAGEDLEMSLDGGVTYKKFYTDGETLQAIANQLNYATGETPTAEEQLTALQAKLNNFGFATSVDGKTFNSYHSGVSTDLNDDAFGTAVAGSEYLEFNINFRSLKALSVAPNSDRTAGTPRSDKQFTSVVSSGLKFTPGLPMSITTNTGYGAVAASAPLTFDPAVPYQGFAQNAARISYTNIDTVTEANEITKIYEPNKLHTSNTGGFGGSQNLANSYFLAVMPRNNETAPITADAKTTNPYCLTNCLGDGTPTYDAYHTAIEAVKTSYATAPASTVYLDGSIDNVSNAVVTLVTAGTNEATSGNVNYFTGAIKVRIWLEGADSDAHFAILKDHLKVALGFTGYPAA